jgi:Ala-tRNA(Pro) deacylase
MIAQKLRSYLEEHGVDYTVDEHPRAVDAQRLAAAEHVSGWDIAKPVLLMVGGELAMVVVPGAVGVDLEKAQNTLGHNEVRMAREDEFEQVFDDSEGGAEPPFGNLYNVPTFLDEQLHVRPTLTFRAGTHTETVTIDTDVYMRLVEPEIVDVAGGNR